ncbi:hypothetical protein [Pedobacter aquatilis]|uniref:hypothetical protein n=1 Tax=Pedobacter aquatilis TaxID=351343 RepID=UPI00292E7C1A|nr:hypothetical protein [Pedobacter aquatilis]
MKITITLILWVLSFYLFAQQKLPVIRAGSNIAKIHEEGNSISSWGINPKLSPDVYTTSKIIKSKMITFKTDLDSITFKIKPGGKHDFIVILKEKDSCLIRIKAPELKNYSKLKPAVHDSIFFSLNKYNTNLIPLLFNSTDSLLMNFDTGATEMSLTMDALETKVKSNTKLYHTLYDIKLGNRSYQSKVYDTQIVGHEADGVIGWDHFDGMVVELNYDDHLMVVHSKMPDGVVGNAKVSKFNIEYTNNRPFIKAEIIQNGVVYQELFLFDTGYQKTVMLDEDLLKNKNFPSGNMEIISKVLMHGTNNNEIPVITANLQKIKLGNYVLENIPAQLLGKRKPMRGIDIHVLGSEILKRFNTYIDLQRDRIYLLPNRSYNLPFLVDPKS